MIINEMVEMSCKKITTCEFLKDENFSFRECNATCEEFEWDGVSIPFKLEYFLNKQLNEIFKTLQKENGEDLEKILKQDIWAYISGATRFLETNPDLIFSVKLRKLMADFKKDLEGTLEESKKINWIVFTKNVRMEVLKLYKVLSKD